MPALRGYVVCMSRSLDTEVLVVGAGPTGLVTALLLAEAGVEVVIIDREQRPATHSYACGLHPASLELFDRLGLLHGVQAQARRIDRVAFYSPDGKREAEVSLASLPVKHPFVLVCPQDQLEALLASRLAEQGCAVRWHHRLATLEPGSEGMTADVDQLVGTATGCAVPRWHWVVGRTIQVAAKYVVGADGHYSVVRQGLGIANETLGPTEHYVVYEFEPERELADELRVVLTDRTKSALWPLPGGRCRWSFQLAGHAEADVFEKDRDPFWGEPPARAQLTRQRLEERLAAHAPWFDAGIRALDWAVDIQFQQRLARQYGQGRCWLAGDAAHQTSPAGIQSMNLGLLEAEDLAGKLAQVLRGEASEAVLSGYGQAHHSVWRRLLDPAGPPAPDAAVKPWVAAHRRAILSALPASGSALALLLAQLGLGSP